MAETETVNIFYCILLLISIELTIFPFYKYDEKISVIVTSEKTCVFENVIFPYKFILNERKTKYHWWSIRRCDVEYFIEELKK